MKAARMPKINVNRQPYWRVGDVVWTARQLQVVRPGGSERIQGVYPDGEFFWIRRITRLSVSHIDAYYFFFAFGE
jgi:hypothetical protein